MLIVSFIHIQAGPCMLWYLPSTVSILCSLLFGLMGGWLDGQTFYSRLSESWLLWVAAAKKTVSGSVLVFQVSVRQADLYTQITHWKRYKTWMNMEVWVNYAYIPCLAKPLVLQGVCRAYVDISIYILWQPATEEHERGDKDSLLWAVRGIHTSAHRGSP